MHKTEIEKRRSKCLSESKQSKSCCKWRNLKVFMKVSYNRKGIDPFSVNHNKRVWDPLFIKYKKRGWEQIEDKKEENKEERIKKYSKMYVKTICQKVKLKIQQSFMLECKVINQ